MNKARKKTFLNEVAQTQKDKYDTHMLICGH